MKKYILLSFCMVMFPLCAMQKASSSVALEGAFLPDVARQLDESTFGISQQPIQAGGCNCGSLSLQTSIKIAAAGLVGAGLGEGAYRLGLIKCINLSLNFQIEKPY